MLRMLVIEDEKPISQLIKMNLETRGYCCDCAYDGISAANRVEQHRYDLILIDVMLPGIDGFELMEFIQPLHVPVIFLTAKTSVEDRVKGLRLGADDYLTKPFAVVELLARVDAVLRRYQKTEEQIVIGDVEINVASYWVKKSGQQVDLTPKEFQLLLLLVQNKNIALFRETIFERVWQSDYLGDSRTVDLHVQRLRKKLGWENQLKAVYKVGYRLEV